MTRESLTDPATAAFVVIPVVLAVVFSAGVWLSARRAGEPAPRAARSAALAIVAVGIWMLITWRAADSGALRQWDAFPPPFMLLAASIFLISARIAFSATGLRLARHIPLWAHVGVQAFRYPLELAMHEMAVRGVMPDQMTYTGRNFDIVTGVTALLVSGLLLTGRIGARGALVWNVMGLALLVNIVTIAIISTPAIRYFGDDKLNVFVMSTPFVWLPAVMVTAALTGHLLIFRALSAASRR